MRFKMLVEEHLREPAKAEQLMEVVDVMRVCLGHLVPRVAVSEDEGNKLARTGSN